MMMMMSGVVKQQKVSTDHVSCSIYKFYRLDLHGISVLSVEDKRKNEAALHACCLSFLTLETWLKYIKINFKNVFIWLFPIHVHSTGPVKIVLMILKHMEDNPFLKYEMCIFLQFCVTGRWPDQSAVMSARVRPWSRPHFSSRGWSQLRWP